MDVELPTFSVPVCLCVVGEADEALILSSSYGLGFRSANLAEVIVPFVFDFTWGELPSPQKLATYLDACSDSHGRGEHWSDFVDKHRLNDDRLDLSLLEFCEPYDEIDLWFDPRPANQSMLVWLLDFFRPYPELLSKIRSVLTESEPAGSSFPAYGYSAACA